MKRLIFGIRSLPLYEHLLPISMMIFGIFMAIKIPEFAHSAILIGLVALLLYYYGSGTKAGAESVMALSKRGDVAAALSLFRKLGFGETQDDLDQALAYWASLPPS